jgi:hypothetical protein
MLHRAHPPYRRQFDDADFQFGFEIALGATYHQAADVGGGARHCGAHP